MKRAAFTILALVTLAGSLSVVQAKPPDDKPATMPVRQKSDREQHGFRGPVKSCNAETDIPGIVDAEGKRTPDIHGESIEEFDADGRILASRNLNSDSSWWGTRYSYDASGHLSKIVSEADGQAATETIYAYDQQGRLQSITDSSDRRNPVSFRYDENGRKTQVLTSRAEDYRGNTASGGSPFEGLELPPNLPGGGTSTTLYDDQDRATEVQVRNASGEVVNRAVRKYDQQGHVIEEKQILDNPTAMFPPEAFAKIVSESGASEDQVRQEMSAKIRELMGGQSSHYSITYGYDTHGRVTHTIRQVFNRVEEIETTYNEHGDTESKITRGKESGDGSAAELFPRYSEARYTYRYDEHGNWVERTTSYRSSPDGALKSSSVGKRTLTYY